MQNHNLHTLKRQVSQTTEPSLYILCSAPTAAAAACAGRLQHCAMSRCCCFVCHCCSGAVVVGAAVCCVQCGHCDGWVSRHAEAECLAEPAAAGEGPRPVPFQGRPQHCRLRSQVSRMGASIGLGAQGSARECDAGRLDGSAGWKNGLTDSFQAQICAL